jgi:hypothetical protein
MQAVVNWVLAGVIPPKVGNCALFGLSAMGRTLEAETQEKLLERQDALEDRIAQSEQEREQRFVGHA